MKPKTIALILALALVLALSACGPELMSPMPAEPAANTATPTSLPPTAIPSPTATTEPARAVADPLRQAVSPAIDDLAGRLGVSPDQIEIVAAEEVEWPDASMGCPAPGMMYAQVITPGMKVTLAHDGQTYDYHGKSPDDLFLCGADGPVPPGELPGQSREDAPTDPAAAVMLELAQGDLMVQLGLTSPDAVRTILAEAVEWPDSSLECKGGAALDVITPGYRIVLQVAEQQYEYHTDTLGTVVLCKDGS